MRKVVLSWVLLFASFAVKAQFECYFDNNEKGEQSYEDGDYEVAIGYFKSAQLCLDRIMHPYPKDWNLTINNVIEILELSIIVDSLLMIKKYREAKPILEKILLWDERNSRALSKLSKVESYIEKYYLLDGKTPKFPWPPPIPSAYGEFPLAMVLDPLIENVHFHFDYRSEFFSDILDSENYSLYKQSRDPISSKYNKQIGRYEDWYRYKYWYEYRYSDGVPDGDRLDDWYKYMNMNNDSNDPWGYEWSISTPINYYKTVRLRQINDMLSSSLQNAGYYDIGYYAIPDGFALVTRVEQIDSDGIPKDLPTRWSKEWNVFDSVTFNEFLESIFFSNPGYFRAFVFLVFSNSESLEFLQSKNFDMTQAYEWIIGGNRNLPSEIGKLKFEKDGRCIVLVYSFKQKEPEKPATQIIPSNLPVTEHLLRSNIIKSK